MSEINFCPFCNAPSHKITMCKDNICFCRECNKFFIFDPVEFKCPKCESTKIEDSDFPTPDGQTVFQCRKCMKMYSAEEFFKKNEKKSKIADITE